ncbi:MAG: MFS transporter [Paludibacter sp.]|nr:MFS transporter [Bacteroidales bacterium]MCM1069152.1 MFS transporter [Prevotella sp.]MCM1353591.1 MFS transporter [Bacteroides sp.]MCM1442752.1 MFS transporter [Muribaculum sp.]MCM1481612.1 MFS transporter [Paludibacter sp.]
MKLSVKEKLGYSLGDTASHFVWDLVGFWLLIFYTDIYGLSPATAGVIMFVGSIWDAVMDPVVGIISDRTTSRWGKFRPYLLFGAVPYAILAVLAFTTPAFGATGKFAYALITCLLLRTAYACVNLPYSSLGAVMTDDSAERAGLNTYRFIAAYIGQFIVTGGALYLVKYLGAWGNNGVVDQAQGYQYTVALFGLLSVLCFLVAFFTTKERVPAPPKQDNNVLKDFKYLFLNKAWIVLTLVGIVSFIMFAMQNAAIAYYFKYYIQDAENVQLFNVLGTVALIVALPASKPLAQRLGNRMVYILSSVVSGIFFALIFVAGDNLILVYTFNILAKMAYAPAVPLLWTMLADVADYGEWKFNRRTTGLCFSASVLAQKLGWAIGAAAAGWLLGATHFVANAEVQSDSAMMGIRLLVSVIPGVLYASCALIMYFYNLDNTTMSRMKTELEQRRLQTKTVLSNE